MASVKFFKNAPAVTYRDESSRDDVASNSSAVPLLDQADLNISDPPPYTDDCDQPTTTRPRGTLDKVVEQRVSENHRGSTTVRISPTLSIDPVALKEFIIEEAAICPRPYIQLRGTHTLTRREANGQKKRQEVVDFEIRIDVTDTICRKMTHYIGTPEWMKLHIIENSAKAYRGGRTKSRAKGFKADLEASQQVYPSLGEYCHLFCASSAKLKSFTLKRTITNRSEETLRQNLTAFIRATHYRGHIHITFPMYNRSITVHSPHSISRLRHNPYIWWTCVLLQLWIIIWPILWFMTRRWEVVEAQWPYKIWVPGSRVDGSRPSGLSPGETFGNATGENGNGKWEYVRESEEDWCRRWRRGIMCAVEAKTKDWITEALGEAVEARLGDMEVERGVRKVLVGVGDHQRRAREGGSRSGLLGAVVGLARSVSGEVNDVHRGWGGDC